MRDDGHRDVSMPVVIPFPGPLFSLAAFSGSPFDDVLSRLGVTPDVHVVDSFGKPIDRARTFYLAITPGRHAALTKSDSQGEFEILLQRVGNRFYERELAIVAHFAGIGLEGIERYCNPPFRYAPDPPTNEDRAYWRRHLHMAYPYD